MITTERNPIIGRDRTVHFESFRKHIIGIDEGFESPFGYHKIVYADWTASGRMYGPIEKHLQEKIYPFVANTHTETNTTGSLMTMGYDEAKNLIKKHVGANHDDILVSSDSGMTGVVNKFQRILGLKVHERFRDKVQIPEHQRPVVFITHMEHHSNQTSWLETICDVIIINPDAQGLVDLRHFEQLLSEYKNRPLKFAAITSCSNVTGIFTPYHTIAKMIHQVGGYCFVDFAASAPYVYINMHPADPEEALDAIYFSPHKFLGGPGSTGILIFNKVLYQNNIPDHPGGGTVVWTDPWGFHVYKESIEDREDGGTPAFLQTMRIALSIELKNRMGIDPMLNREHDLLHILFKGLDAIPGLHILADQSRERLSIVSMYFEDLHFNLVVKLLNDRFGIQVRGGCSCAGTYGHYLLEISPEYSRKLFTTQDKSARPGWIRISLHPTNTEEEVHFIIYALNEVKKHAKRWSQDYKYLPSENTFQHISEKNEHVRLLTKELFQF